MSSGTNGASGIPAGLALRREAGRADDRPRWLVVGDGRADGIESLVREELGASVTRAPDFLAALGELAHTGAEVIVGPAAALRGMVEPSIAALRELAPEARLVVTYEGDRSEADDAVAAGADGAIPARPSVEQLRRASGEAPPAPEPEPEPAAEPGRGGSLRRRAEVVPEALDQFGRLREPARPDEPDADADADDGGDVGGGVDHDTPGEEVGDTDLIRAILSGRGLRRMALDVVRERSGLEGVELVERGDDPPPDHVAERVSYRGREFGQLCAPPPADGEALAGWAGWLAHWLAMDEHVAQLKDMSMRDALTGVWNRRYFDRFLHRVLEWAAKERSQVTLLVFDIDDFKLYNDRYGHAAGDDILKESSKLMLSVVREHDVVARIGGDEFAVIFWDADPRTPRTPGSQHPHDVVKAARRFQQAIVKHHFPKLASEAPGTLTISGGLASFPWDGRTPEELLNKADEMAMQSKRQGKNAITFGPGAEQWLREPAS